jgi:hypothetical protein
MWTWKHWIVAISPLPMEMVYMGVASQLGLSFAAKIPVVVAVYAGTLWAAKLAIFGKNNDSQK